MTWTPAFRFYAVARLTTWAGSAMTAVALPVLLYQRTGSAALAGALAALEALPYLLLGLPAGALADRWDHRRTLVVTMAASGVVVAGVPAAAAAGLLSTPQIVLTAVATSALFVFFDAAAFGALPRIVGLQGLAAATGSLMAVGNVILLGAPALAGVILATTGAPAVLAVDAATYAVAACCLAAVHLHPLPERPDEKPASGRRWRRTVDDVLVGVRHLAAPGVVRTLTLVGAAASTTAGAVASLLVVVAATQLHLDVDDARVGLLFTASAAGSLVVGLLLAQIHRRVRVGRLTLAGLVISAGATALLALTTHWPAALAAVALWQVGTTAVILNGIVVRQAITPAHLQGRVNTTARMIAYAGTPAGAALAGVAAQAWGTRTALLLATLGAIAPLVVGLSGGLRRVPRIADLIAASRPLGAGTTQPDA